MPNKIELSFELFCAACSGELSVEVAHDNFIRVHPCLHCKQDRYMDGVKRGIEKYKQEVEGKEVAQVEKKDSGVVSESSVVKDGGTKDDG